MSMPAGVPFGYCWCGCGRKTKIAKQNDRRRGHIKGQPVRFLSQHHARVQHPDPTTRLWSQVDRTTTPDGCWPWIGYYRDKAGYGQIKVNGRTQPAHRLAWILTHGPIPLSFLVVMHTCDNPPCCNPAHLELKEPDKKIKDRDQKGRQARGERHASAKLTEALVQEIRSLYQRGVRGRGLDALAKQFNMSPNAIRRILIGETWKHVPRPLR
jgi:HNH endonuclease